MELYPLDIAIHVVNIVILFVLLRVLVYKPVRKFMRERDEKIAKQMEDAQSAMQQAEVMQAQSAQQLASANEQAEQTVRNSEERAVETANSILANAKSQAEALQEEARQEMEAERCRTIGAMKEEITDLAVEMASRIMRREVRLEDNRAVAQKFWEKAEVSHASDTESRPTL